MPYANAVELMPMRTLLRSGVMASVKMRKVVAVSSYTPSSSNMCYFEMPLLRLRVVEFTMLTVYLDEAPSDNSI
jgi:hypothetical protein